MSSESGSKEEMDETAEFEQYVSVKESMGIESAVGGRAGWQ